MDQNSKNQAEEKLKEALHFLEKGEVEKAEDLFVEIFERFPEFIPAKMIFADFLLRANQPALAVSILKEVVKLASKEAYFHYLLGVARMKCGRFNLAHKDLEEANRLWPRKSENLRTWGWIKVMLGELEEGRKLLREAISLDLTNPLAYVDLGMSYAHYYDFDQAWEWLERAKALAPKDSYVLDNLKRAKDLQKEFNQLPQREQEKIRKEKFDPKFQRQLRTEILMESLKNSPATEEDLEETIEELKMAGFAGQIAIAKDFKTLAGKAAMEYINHHRKIKDVERKLSPEEERDSIKKLLDLNTSLANQKDLILILAHQGTESSLNALKKFSKISSPQLKVWIKMAINECQSFLEGKESGEPPVQIHKIEE